MSAEYVDDPLPSPPPEFHDSRTPQFSRTHSLQHDRCASWNDAWRQTNTPIQSAKYLPAPDPTLYGRPPRRPFLTEFPISTDETRKKTNWEVEKTNRIERCCLRHGRRNAMFLICVLTLLIICLVGWLSMSRLVTARSMIQLIFWFTFFGSLVVFVGAFWRTSPILWFEFAWKISLMIVAVGVLVLLIIYQFHPGPFLSAWVECKQKGQSIAPQLVAQFADRPELVALVVFMPLIFFLGVVVFTLVDCWPLHQWRRELAEKRRARDARPGGKTWMAAQSKSPFARQQSWRFQSTTTFPVSTVRSASGIELPTLHRPPINLVRIPRQAFGEETSTLV